MNAATSRLVPPTALWVVPVSDVGGVARHVLDVASNGLPGWRLIVACPHGMLAEQLSSMGAAVITAPLSPADGIPTSVTALRRIIRALRPAVVHSHLSYADLIAATATLGYPAAVVTTEHGIARDDLVYHSTVWRSRVKALAHTARLRRADALIAVSTSTREVVKEKWHPGRHTRIVVIHNGVDRPTPSPVPGVGLHVVSLARLAPEKGLADLLAGFSLVVREHPQARLTVAGTGPLDSELEGTAERLGIRQFVSFPGHVDPAQLLPKAHVLAQLSVWENTSYSLLDAMVHRLGIVATPVGGNPEMLEPQCLVQRQDHAAVAAGMIAQGLDPALRPALPPQWPTIGDMCEAITTVYAQVRAGRTDP